MEKNNPDYDAVHGIEPGRHLYQFYKSTDDYMKVMIPYFRHGLEKGDACIWLVSERMGLSEVCAMMEHAVPGFVRFLSSGQMRVLSAEKWYLENGHFSETKSLHNAQVMVEQAKADGYTCIRAAGDMAAIPREDWNELESYEREVGKFLTEIKSIALCAYPIHDCTLNDTKMVIDTHHSVLVGHV